MIRVRLFGGFEAWHGETHLRGFESQKVRALFSYLACQRERSFSREHLAGLLWPELDSESSRHALRQAIYNLRSALPGRNTDQPPLLTSHLEVRLNPETGLWLDVAQFEGALDRGRGRDGTDPHHLAVAAQLYRGDFLSGFFVRDSPKFEDWLIAEQERLRDSALEALRSLILSYRNRGELRFAIHYGRQLVALDPLAEESRRDLIRLLGQAGRRSEALAEFEALSDELDRELGVGPTTETRTIYEAIRDEPVTVATVPDEGEPIGPFIPLVGRQNAWERLDAAWRQALRGETTLSLVVGEIGVGKTRLVRSFLDAATGLERATVLRASGRRLGVPAPYLAWQEIFQGTRPKEPQYRPDGNDPFAPLGIDARKKSKLKARPAAAQREARVERILETLRKLATNERPLILFFDDLDQIDRDSLSLLEQVAQRLGRERVWMVGTVSEVSQLPAELVQGDHIHLDRLDYGSIEEIAAALVGEDRASELAKWLLDSTRGLPLGIAERINLLWDQGNLAPLGTGRWTLTRLDANDRLGEPIDALRERLRLLPSSTRRLASVAALCATPWSANLLESAGEEHPVVVALGLEVLLKRWLIRPSARFWTPDDDPGAALAWVDEPRRREYEFTHAFVRQAVLAGVDPARRRMLHAQLGTHLATADREVAPEEIAAQLWSAGQWQRAIPFLERGLARAEQLGAESAVAAYRDLLERARAESSTVG